MPGPENQSRQVCKGKDWEHTGPTFTIVISLSLQDMLSTTIRKQIDSLGIADVVRLQKRVLIAAKAHNGELKLGTFFGGSELIRFVIDHLLYFLRREYGCKLDLVHVFSVAKDEWKRDLINSLEQGLNAPQHSFSDILELEANEWCGEELLSGEKMRLPITDINFFGFDCDTIAAPNMSETPFNKATCLELAFGKTGKTGRATVKAIIDLRSPTSVLENSKLLGAADLKYLTQCLNAHGFYVHAFVASALDYGSSTARERQIMVVHDEEGAFKRPGA